MYFIFESLRFIRVHNLYSEIKKPHIIYHIQHQGGNTLYLQGINVSIIIWLVDFLDSDWLGRCNKSKWVERFLDSYYFTTVLAINVMKSLWSHDAKQSACSARKISDLVHIWQTLLRSVHIVENST